MKRVMVAIGAANICGAVVVAGNGLAILAFVMWATGTVLLYAHRDLEAGRL